MVTKKELISSEVKCSWTTFDALSARELARSFRELALLANDLGVVKVRYKFE